MRGTPDRYCQLGSVLYSGSIGPAAGIPRLSSFTAAASLRAAQAYEDGILAVYFGLPRLCENLAASMDAGLYPPFQ